MQKLYAFDYGIYNPFKSGNVKVKVQKATKENEVLFTEDKPWEVRFDNSYPTVFYDPYYKIYRCYYSTFTYDPASSNYTLEERQTNTYKPSVQRVVSLCYAYSYDGKEWIKPELNLCEFEGSTSNNIIGHYLHGTSVLYDEHEKDPSKRYKLFTKLDYGNGIHYFAVAFSSDGINFSSFIRLKDFELRGDTNNSIIYDEINSQYYLVSRTWEDSMRIPVIAVSSDFINWKVKGNVMATNSYDRQIYAMPVFTRGDYKLGLASIFHEGDIYSKDFDKVDLELMYSYKDREWRAVEEGVPIIDRGQGDYYSNGAFDNSCIYASRPVEIEDRTYIYYIGGNGQHTNFREGSLARAYIEGDRFSYLAAKDPDKEALVYTNGFMLLDNKLYIDCDVLPGGYLYVSCYDKDHNKRNDLDVSLTYSKEDKLYTLEVKNKLPTELVMLEFRFKNVKLYSFYGDIDVSRIEDDNRLLRG